MDKREFILSTIPRMAEYTFPYITSVIGVSDLNGGEHVGSGLRCILDGRRAVVTAEHVIQRAIRYPAGMAISTGFGKKPFLVHGEIRVDAIRDIAVYHLPPDYPDDVDDVKFWAQDRIDESDDRLSTDYLFVHGFPGKRSRFLALGPGVFSKSLPYGAMQRLEALPSDLRSDQFALDFDPTNMHSLDAETDFAVDPHGLSGSPVWRIGLSGRSAAEWKPELSLIVGFLTQWRPAEKVIVASRASHFSSHS